MVRHPRDFNPWWVVFGSTLALVVCNGPVALFTFGVFLKPITAEFGWNRGTISAASGMASLMIAVAAPVTGMLVDRWGVRRVLLPIILLFSLSLAAISLTPPSPIIFIALYAIMGLVSAGDSPQPYVKTIAAWFDRRRGLAVGIAMAGVGLGIILVPQLTRVLIDAYGWRVAYIGLGVVAFAVAFPAVAILIHEPAAAPEPNETVQSGNAMLPGLSVREALTGSWRFWLLAVPVFLVAAAVNGTVGHIVPLLTDHGVSVPLATSMLSIVGLASIIGRLLCGYLADRLFAPNVAAGFFVLPCIGIYVLIIGAHNSWPLIGAATLGLALGCEIDMIAFLTTRYFGLRRFGELYGYLFAVFAAGSGLGQYLMGIAFDAFHSYDIALGTCIVALIIASLLVSRLGAYVFPVEAAHARPATPPRNVKETDPSVLTSWRNASPN
jgi:predicted MFS family arabinose efflux permease